MTANLKTTANVLISVADQFQNEVNAGEPLTNSDFLAALDQAAAEFGYGDYAAFVAAATEAYGFAWVLENCPEF